MSIDKLLEKYSRYLKFIREQQKKYEWTIDWIKYHTELYFWLEEEKYLDLVSDIESVKDNYLAMIKEINNYIAWDDYIIIKDIFNKYLVDDVKCKHIFSTNVPWHTETMYCRRCWYKPIT